MSNSCILFTDKLDDLIFARHKSSKTVRFASDVQLLSKNLDKYGLQAVFVRDSCLSEKLNSLCDEKSFKYHKYSTMTELSLLLEKFDSDEDIFCDDSKDSSDSSSILNYSFDEEKHKMLCEMSPAYAKLLGSSPAMQKLRAEIIKVAAFDISVLLLGETGTGKTLIARAIHELSSRRKAAYKQELLINSNETLIESRLFGVSKGAFTGALESAGTFEITNGGTLFLDEITEIGWNIQGKLLQVLSEGVISRIGSNKEIHVDNRMIFATNKNIEIKVKKGEFREDLYHRINDVTLRIPPLRERIEDIPEIAEAVLIELQKENIYKTISPAAISALKTLPWTGNIRQLEKVVRKAALDCQMEQSEVIEPRHIRL